MYDLFADDITFCASKCDKTDCFRHESNIKQPDFPHSFATFKGTDSCPDSELSKPSHRSDDLMDNYDSYMSEVKRMMYGIDEDSDASNTKEI